MSGEELVRQLRDENEALRKQNAELVQRNAGLVQENEELQQLVAGLRGQVTELQQGLTAAEERIADDAGHRLRHPGRPGTKPLHRMPRPHSRKLVSVSLSSFSIPNDGVTVISDPQSAKEWEVLRYELESFVCSGEYQAGMERVLSTYLGHLDQPRQPAVWVSGFYGSGKSHFVRVLQYLWQDAVFPDGARARSLVALPLDIADHLRELTAAGKRAGGLWSAAGTLGVGGGSIRLALLSILFQAAGLPARYAPARFVLWLRQTGIYDAVKPGASRLRLRPPSPLAFTRL